MKLYENNHLLDREKQKTIRKPRKSFSNLLYKDVRRIIALANKNKSKRFIQKETGISECKIKRCLNITKNIKTTPNLRKPWKRTHKKTTCSIQNWENHKNNKKQTRVFNYETNAIAFSNYLLIFVKIFKQKVFLLMAS